jgi:hypothetical protein
MLQKINFLPGFNKQLTESQAEGQWIAVIMLGLDIQLLKK